MSVADGLTAVALPAGEVEHPEPVVSASIYAQGALDTVLLRAVGAFIERCGADRHARDVYVWTLRYSRRGEHLKVRLHGAAEDVEWMRELLAEAVESCLANLTDKPQVERIDRADAPAIDEEDEGTAPHPDRSLMWTRYRRSPVTFGADIWLRDDRFNARFTRCLAAALQLMLDAPRDGLEGGIPDRVRHSTLLKALVSGIAALGLGPRAGDYLRYHRDWLLRFFVGDVVREAEILATFDERVEGNPSMVSSLGMIARSHWDGANEEEDGPWAAWRAAGAALAAHLDACGDDPQRLTDPFALGPRFPPAFKLLHGTANQFGISSMDEAFLHHLLLKSVNGRGEQARERGPRG